MKELESLLEEIDINNNKVLIFTQWTTMQTVINMHIKKKFKIEPMLIYGGVSNEDRSKIIKEFKESNKSEILIGTDAMAYGVNLPDIDYLIEYDIPWNPSQRAQRTNRIYRLSSNNRKIIVDLINEFEKPVYNVIKRKSTEFQTVVDGKDIEEIEYDQVELDSNFSLLKKILKTEVL
jgi:ATP-dependent RNA helicase RhlE